MTFQIGYSLVLYQIFGLIFRLRANSYLRQQIRPISCRHSLFNSIQNFLQIKCKKAITKN